MWDRTDQVIQGTYMGVPFRGVVSYSRVKLGGDVLHVVDLFEEITVYGSVRDSVLILESDDFSVDCESVSQYD